MVPARGCSIQACHRFGHDEIIWVGMVGHGGISFPRRQGRGGLLRGCVIVVLIMSVWIVRPTTGQPRATDGRAMNKRSKRSKMTLYKKRCGVVEGADTYVWWYSDCRGEPPFTCPPSVLY